MAAFEDRVAALKKKEKDAKENEVNKALEEEVLRELREEELRLIVMGYEFQENESTLEGRLVCDILKEGAELPGRVKIIWKKGKVDNMRSIIILKALNKWTRDSLLKNQRPGKNFVVKQSIPKRFREVEGQLKEKARVVRLTNFNKVRTEIEIRGN